MKISNLLNSKHASIMGILNLTPDSFSDGGCFYDYDAAMRRIEDMIKEGADIIDIGAESTRPGAAKVSLSEEIKPLEKVILSYKKHFDTPLSLDTTKSQVAAFGCEHGVDIVNDISGCRFDPNMVNVLESFQCYTVIMHIQKDPKTMQEKPVYDAVVDDVFQHLNDRISELNKKNIRNIIVDPGIGFGKTLEHNLKLIKQFETFQDLNVPTLIGTSRKSFIGTITNTEVEERLEGTLISSLMAIQKGAQIVRVHDVKSMKRALQVYNAVEDVA